MFNKIGNGELAQADGRISVCFGLNISGCLYLSPPHQYRQNLTKSWISPARAETAGPIRVWIYWIWIYPQNGSNMWRWRGMLGISDSLFTICQARAPCVQEKTKVGWGKWFWPGAAEDISCQRRMQMLAKDCRDLQIWGISLVLTERRQKYPAPDSIAVSLFGNMIG